jgi:hypothetical protein
MPRCVDGDRVIFERRAVRVGVHGGTRRPVPIAVPLHQVDLAAAAGIVIGQPPGRPAPGGEAVEFDAGFPGGPDGAPPGAAHQATEVAVRISGGAQHEIGFAVHEDVLATVSVVPENSGRSNPVGLWIGVRWLDTTHFDESGAEPAGPSNSS